MFLMLNQFVRQSGLHKAYLSVKFGRKQTIDRAKLLELKKDGIGATEIANQLGIGRDTVYKILNES